jgi:hypothetical protein
MSFPPGVRFQSVASGMPNGMPALCISALISAVLPKA